MPIGKLLHDAALANAPGLLVVSPMTECGPIIRHDGQHHRLHRQESDDFLGQPIPLSAHSFPSGSKSGFEPVPEVRSAPLKTSAADIPVPWTAGPSVPRLLGAVQLGDENVLPLACWFHRKSTPTASAKWRASKGKSANTAATSTAAVPQRRAYAIIPSAARTGRTGVVDQSAFGHRYRGR